MTYRNFIPIENWEIYFLRYNERCRFHIFWSHFTFTANKLMFIEYTVFVNKPIFRLFIVITPCQIHLRDINKKECEKNSKFYLKFGVILTYLKWIFSDIKNFKLGLRTALLVKSLPGYFLDNHDIYLVEVCSVINNTPIQKDELCYLAVFKMVMFYTQNNFSTFDVICIFS